MSSLFGHGEASGGVSQVLQSAGGMLMAATGLSSAKAVQSILLLFVLTALDFSNLQDDNQAYQHQLNNNNTASATPPPAGLYHHNQNQNFTNTPQFSLEIISTISKNHKKKDSGSSGNSLFQYNPNALEGISPIPFQDEWINDFNIAPYQSSPSSSSWPTPESPKQLDLPDYLQVFDLTKQQQSSSLRTMGQQARHLIDQHLHQGSGAMLFRNLHQTIHNSSDFATFWEHVVLSSNNNNNDNNWNIMNDHLSCYNRKRQRLYGQVDRVDTDVPAITIGPHNEHSCNPRPSEKIFFYALHTAAHGGESLLRRNVDMQVPSEAWQLLEQQHARHGGALTFTRSYPDATKLLSVPKEERHPTEMSWQERCHTNSTQKAKEYFRKHHGITNVTFDQEGTLTAHNLLPGYHHHHEHSTNENENPVWFNRIDYGFPVTMADGSTFPLDLQAYLKRQKWHETTALKLQPGDWLVLDNRRVQHGRLPYRDAIVSNSDKPRQLLVTYTA
ncbi:taurine catabolism dioxygenase taud tfda [Seminavis robusta]|uniref:Taurine catabolism dioxygenase taud tfda n=1 Tax=Seminavis robusta TaxID=568900 RepID=A0A9N8E5W3_9STRA|nr:taurine catabolism dioxygenase taud tfda [Seminavis robusta]|eukprot:Sro574_g169220.1 taurine catabolism dioxygenase taud tfda (500) ;mRNA; r:36604-38103